jgi:hypothetical protein
MGRWISVSGVGWGSASHRWRRNGRGDEDGGSEQLGFHDYNSRSRKNQLTPLRLSFVILLWIMEI